MENSDERSFQSQFLNSVIQIPYFVLRIPNFEMPLITLTTDFGTRDSYVAQMKGAILSINPAVQIVDVTHAIPPQDVSRAAVVVEEIARVFPSGAIHVAVVDPGVGSHRALLAAEAAGQRFLAPDNGLLTMLLRRYPPDRVHCLLENRFWRNPVSATFHGRDILAPVAAHLSLGSDLAEFGPAMSVAALVRLSLGQPQQVGGAVIGRVESIDAFGNLITNICESDLPPGDRHSLSISLGDHLITGISHYYSERPSGGLVAVVGSSGRLEIAINGGSAATKLYLSVGTEIRLESDSGG